MQTTIRLSSCTRSSSTVLLLLRVLAGTQLISTVLGRMAEFAPGPTYSISGSWLPNSLPGYCFNARSPADVALTDARIASSFNTGTRSAVAVRSTVASSGASPHTSQAWIVSSLCDKCNPDRWGITLVMVEVTLYTTGNYKVCAYASAARYLDNTDDTNVWPEYYNWAWTNSDSKPMFTAKDSSMLGFGITSINFVTSFGGVGGWYNDVDINLPTSVPGINAINRGASAYDVSIARAHMNGGFVGGAGNSRSQAAVFPSPVAATIPGAVNWIAAINDDGWLKMVQVTVHMYRAGAANTSMPYAYISAARYSPASYTATKDLTGEEVGNAWRSSSSVQQATASNATAAGYGLHSLRFTTSAYISVSNFLPTSRDTACMPVSHSPLSTMAVRSPVMNGGYIGPSGSTRTPAIAFNSGLNTSIVAICDCSSGGGDMKMLQLTFEFSSSSVGCAYASAAKYIGGQRYTRGTEDLNPAAVLSAWRNSSSNTMNVATSTTAIGYGLESAVITASSVYFTSDWLPTTAPGFCFRAVSAADVDITDAYISGEDIGASGYETIKAAAFPVEVNATAAVWIVAFCQGCTSTVEGNVKMVEVVLHRNFADGQICAFATAAKYSVPVAHPTSQLTRPYVAQYWHDSRSEYVMAVSSSSSGYGIRRATFVRHS